MSDVPDRALSLQEYYLLEETSGTKHEYYAGASYAMTGASVEHNVIVANIIGHLYGRLREKTCTVYPSDLRLKVEATGLYTYPDVQVICAPIRNADGRKDTVTNPTVVIEVLSPTTESYDRGKKFQHYRSIETLRDYLIIAQEEAHIEQYSRQAGGQWLLAEFTQLDQVVSVTSIDCSLPLAAVYEKVFNPR